MLSSKINPLEAMLPTLEKLFGIRRRPLEAGAPEAEAVAAQAGIPSAAVVRVDGMAEGVPFVAYFITPPAGEQKKLPQPIAF